MSSLTFSEKRFLENFLQMQSGTVLSLSNRDFADLFRTVLGVNILSEKYESDGKSKAKRLRAFWDYHDDQDVAKILQELLQVGRDDASPISIRRFSEIIERLRATRLAQLRVEAPLNTLWAPDRVKIFISHRDSKKLEAKKLGEILEQAGATVFVAHDTIEPMTKWKFEIERGLESMDGFVAMLSDDYYESVWTNQEFGFALGKGCPIFLYSIDKTDPMGFQMDIQAIKTGPKELVRLFKERFQRHPLMKKAILERFCAAIDGSFVGAKAAFADLVGISLSDEEIEQVVAAFHRKAKSINQLICLLSDGIVREHQGLEGFRDAEYYREVLQTKILDQHSRHRFEVKEVGDEQYKVIDLEASS